MPRMLSLVITMVLALPLSAQALTLNECLAEAREKNPALQAVRRDPELAEAVRQQAVSAYLPRIDLQGGYTGQAHAQAVVINGHAVPTQEQDYTFASASLSQTIYDFGRSRARLERTTLLKDATQSQVSGREQDVFLQVVQSYYGILQAEQQLAANDEEVAQREEHRKIAGLLHEQGVVTRNDVLQADVKLADSRQRRLAMQNRLANTWLQLNFLTGSPAARRAPLTDGQQPLPLADSDALLAQALQRRPELVTLQRLVTADEWGVKEQRSGYYPELFARLAADYVQNDYVREQTMYSATVGVRLNLFDGGDTTARYRQATVALQKSQEQLRLAEAQVRLELQQALNDSRVAAERIATLQVAIGASEENLRINRDRYREQVGTATEVLDAQTLLTQVRSDHAAAQFDFQVALARVRRAAGDL